MSVRSIHRLYALTRRYLNHEGATAYVARRAAPYGTPPSTVALELYRLRARDYPEDFA